MTGSGYGEHAAYPPPARPAPWERVRPYPTPHRAQPVRHQPTPEPEPVPEAETSANSNTGLLAASGSIAIATLVSRITGFLKQMLLLTVLGGSIASSFTVASQIPNIISELVLGQVLTAIVVPVLVRAEREDEDGGAAFVRRLFTTAVILLGTAALLAVAAAPLLTTHVFLSTDGKVNTHLTTALSFLLLPAVLFYGLSALFSAVLNTRQIFKPGAWAPVLNNVVVLVVLGIYLLMPGEISLDPVRMSDPKLLTLGIGVTLGVVIQAVSMVPMIRRQGISLKPLWGIDDRLKKFGGMALAIMLYVLISVSGMVFATRVSSHYDAAGPAIYNNAWLLLQLPYGVLGVTVLTAIMPRLSRNAAADDTPAVVDDLSVATRLTLIALVPVITFLTIAGPQVGEALYGYGNFGAGDAGRLGEAVSWSAFTLIPYAITLIQLRVFYARQEVWTPTWIILGITGVKVVLSALVPMVATDNKHVVVLLSGVTGVSFIVGAVIGGLLLRRSLGNLRTANVGKTAWIALLASLAGGAVMLAADRLLRLNRLSAELGGPGSAVRVAIEGLLLLVVTFTILRLANVSEVVSITVAVTRRFRRRPEPDVPAHEPVQHVVERPYDPVMDAETMVLPVLRPEATDITGVGQFTYPIRQRVTGEALSQPRHVYPGPHPGASRRPPQVYPGSPGQLPAPRAGIREGVRVGDDAIADTRTGNAATDAARPPGAGSANVSTAGSRPQSDRKTPPPKDLSPEQARPEPPRRILRGPKLIPGASVAGGRYRLLAPHGGARGLKFWQALDTKLDREVALTFVDADQKAAATAGEDGPQAILSRTLRLGRINSPGLARVLDVVRGSSGGIVVAEWTPGRSLREMAETQPSPIGAARAIRALASAAELAHRAGSSLSIDHPDRVRISVNGDAVLAFPGTLADANPQADVRGLGAMLYALITARWPIGSTPGGVTGTAAPAPTVGGLKLAQHGPNGAPIEPREIRPEVPFEISTIAVRALETDRGVRTAATVQHVLDQASVVDQKTDLMPALRLGQRAPGASGHSLADPEAAEAEAAKSKRMRLILIGLATASVIILGIVAWWLASLFGGSGSDNPLNDPNLGLTTAPPSAAAPAAPAPPAGVAVPASDVRVFSPKGTPDDPDGASLVLDNNAGTIWRTDSYYQPFPALKNGVGLLVTLPNPNKLTRVWINSPSPGTKVEIRSAPSASPTLDQTQIIGSATLGQGVTQIPVQSDQPVRYVLVWITDLAKVGKENQSAIADLGFTATS
ncbi:peptidoglycan biosynthesis protein MviN [Skermania sp. ID1734]|uniref:murein biosynthesis integral membrane protein MurJ n=1 Tax=Skermania sp. ID1734 TaxID=2597516 RepID=UPI0011800F6B|nr:murein biosynthesis integral membrane protein MurJ [Skermania sp. ID1734]TSD99269.1 peptidoglycan biosynthesis protein MviN [Skermania sp. ID1734]